MDLVYITRRSKNNNELRYSLRSIQKHLKCDYRIWVVGEKPTWLQNVNFIPVLQSDTKYKNVINNLLKICTSDIDDDFILMNDDFILLQDIYDFESLKYYKNTLPEQISLYGSRHRVDNYSQGFIDSYNLLKKMNTKEPINNFELHIPFLMNKQKLLQLLQDNMVVEFLNNHNVLLYRSLYGNFYNNFVIKQNDVKIYKDKGKFNTIWMSLSGGMIKNKFMTMINRFLCMNFKKSRFENDKYI